jgi:hypothetical protein
VKLRHVEHLTARISSFSFQIFVALFLYAMGCQFRVNRQQNKRKTAWMRRHVRFAPLPLFPFRSLLELIKPALAGCLITTPPFCLSHWYRNQAIVSLSASRIEARRSPPWPSGLPSSGWERVTQRHGRTRTREIEIGMSCSCCVTPGFFLLSAFPFALVLAFCGMFLLFPLFFSSRVL